MLNHMIREDLFIPPSLLNLKFGLVFELSIRINIHYLLCYVNISPCQVHYQKGDKNVFHDFVFEYCHFLEKVYSSPSTCMAHRFFLIHSNLYLWMLPEYYSTITITAPLMYCSPCVYRLYLSYCYWPQQWASHGSKVSWGREHLCPGTITLQLCGVKILPVTHFQYTIIMKAYDIYDNRHRIDY